MLRASILPRKKDWKANRESIRQVGGLSINRIATIRGLYQTLKAFRMRPEPDDPTKNVPKLGDESLARFGKRILATLEKLREQRIKQLASRVVEAALGAGRMPRAHGRDIQRPGRRVDAPCQVVVIEDLENYRPDETRLRRENQRLMDWAARNVRKYIIEGCQLHGLHFVEVSPRHTSRQDSRTGAPGIRCEDISGHVLRLACQSAEAAGAAAPTTPETVPSQETKQAREIRYWAREIRRIRGKNEGEPKPRESIVASFLPWLNEVPAAATIRLPRRGGDLFVSLGADSRAPRAIQADLNAAANIGLRALDGSRLARRLVVCLGRARDRGAGRGLCARLRGVVFGGATDRAAEHQGRTDFTGSQAIFETAEGKRPRLESALFVGASRDLGIFQGLLGNDRKADCPAIALPPDRLQQSLLNTLRADCILDAAVGRLRAAQLARISPDKCLRI